MGDEGLLHRLLQPARPRSIPHVRAWNITLRTLHLMATGTLLGGHVFGAPAGQLTPLLYLAIASGAGLIALEAWPTLHFVFEGWGLMVLAKLTLLCIVLFAWGHHVPLLLAVVALASIGSHMPARFRHYSFLYRRVVKAE